MAGRRAPRGPRGGCSAKAIKIGGYSVTKTVKKKIMTGKNKGKKKSVTVKYSVKPYCRKKAASTKRKAAPKRKASKRKASGSKARKACRSSSTGNRTRQKKNGYCRKGSSRR